jgi:hypothetical protein
MSILGQKGLSTDDAGNPVYCPVDLTWRIAMTLLRRVLALTVFVATVALLAAWPATSGSGRPAPQMPDPPPSPVAWSLYENYWYNYTGYDNAYETAGKCYWFGLSSCGNYISGSGFASACANRGRNNVWVHNEIIAQAEAALATYGGYGVVVHYSDPAFFEPTCSFGINDIRNYE